MNEKKLYLFFLLNKIIFEINLILIDGIKKNVFNSGIKNIFKHLFYFLNFFNLINENENAEKSMILCSIGDFYRYLANFLQNKNKFLKKTKFTYNKNFINFFLKYLNVYFNDIIKTDSWKNKTQVFSKNYKIKNDKVNWIIEIKYFIYDIIKQNLLFKNKFILWNNSIIQKNKLNIKKLDNCLYNIMNFKNFEFDISPRIKSNLITKYIYLSKINYEHSILMFKNCKDFPIYIEIGIKYNYCILLYKYFNYINYVKNFLYDIYFQNKYIYNMTYEKNKNINNEISKIYLNFIKKKINKINKKK